MNAPKPTLGRIVNFVAAPGKIQTGTITAVHSDTCVNLIVTRDSQNDNQYDGHGDAHTVWKTSVSQGDAADPQPNTWHWPVRV